MLATERHKNIIKNLQEHRMVKVTELSKTLNVTEETIRRDLEKLELKHKLKRTHGGAIPIVDRDDDEIPFSDRKIMNKKEKLEVAKKAVSLINEKDIIFLDASTTALYLARFLPNMDLTVLTNSMPVAIELAKNHKVKVMLTGGTVSENSLSLVGPTAIRSIEHFHVDKTFFSCKGFDKEWGVSDSNEQQANVKRRIIKNSDEVILLIDHSKLGQKSFANIDDKNVLDYIVVDKGANIALVENMLSKHTKVII
ncbi:DeoR/GlpR family DNA-binding transcription regulator [Kurthia sibirica]|uniref:DeoR/GlpR transcriptional regulator n=1 Tax=Kurthia sibirica TaxID=202750 RepID=A0A2U3AK29_9BACL|nr:DeoR/GlpR family DNA-binding transcription regulator [Kurthia sibirica]PWI24861.1 DeoR/GlpR transcriptional regulator [Kurthia sibirica]GEK35205.1 putative HTH-type transcriptional regulator YulB [Kurthia sibirica]